ncbi:MAG TPA: GntR family transcriptional regulator, partial [Pseudoduganella sp.]
MPIEAISSKRLYRQIADQLAELVRRGEFKPGDRLPSERDLSQQFDVSRASVR